MWGQFRHLHPNNFPMISCKPNFVFFYLSNKGFEHLRLPHECNPKVGMHLGIIMLHPLHSPPFALGFMGPCTPHSNREPNVKVATMWMNSLGNQLKTYRMSWRRCMNFIDDIQTNPSLLLVEHVVRREVMSWMPMPWSSFIWMFIHVFNFLFNFNSFLINF
jgi:hypothetical protein